MIDLVIIGNGFDLAHGYETKYSQFIDWYIKKSKDISEKSEWGIMDHDLIKIKTALPLYDSHTGELIQKNVKHQYKYHFFKLITDNHKFSDWEGIEREYFLYLYKTVADTHLPYTEDFKSFDLGRGVTQNILNLNLCFSLIKKEFIKYLKEKTPSEVSRIDLNGSILDSLNKLIEDCKADISIKAARKEVSDYKIVLLNFNYTNTAKACAKFIQDSGLKDNVYLINIHGTLENESSIIFGYGDESDKRYSELEEIGNTDILSNFKSFDYFRSNEYSTLIGLLENQEYNIHIMGHSCGVSDRVLLKELFCTSNCKKIKIYYHKIDDITNDYKEKTMNISRIFPLDQKAEMRKKIINIKDCRPL